MKTNNNSPTIALCPLYLFLVPIFVQRIWWYGGTGDSYAKVLDVSLENALVARFPGAVGVIPTGPPLEICTPVEVKA